MVEGPQDEAVIEQPQAKNSKIDEKGGGIESTDELKKENMSDSYSEGGGVYGEVMKEEDECEMDEDEDEDDEEEEEDECEMDEDEDEDEEEEEEDECEVDEGRHVNLLNQESTGAFVLRMMEFKPIEFKDEEILSHFLYTPLYKNCVDGFDVTHSDHNALGLLRSVELPFKDSEWEKWIVSIAEVAINKYNEDHQAHWKYKETMKANSNQIFHGSVYFITFKATHEDQDIKTFEAKVCRDTLGQLNYEDRVEFVRIKS